ncbi:MAG: NrdH-redoxin [Candidatus Staskawiczbacteria bacterium RIFCSPLOWO2_01_FULL_40_39]|uniref:NrdH-redoxin n=1 Tax=Candidatus Staskawiczbacteria bacterium RIFCSPHIGHO2_01_FULL_39_25 TaxID=1802202 RepID=A0A1G2HS78_9BACT|nr:MAG: NrdH-redoxin [Candidatus Staskawiczbacteria bacterium RIFCSPHIGHO2_01_FULL_39_25]OGZ72746.1 MAG: NrdH-redoxin [Candidatus Staskawiczbacteria bacterium RIFCSPLOWO2_01_FULL_40_39]OGZ76754.1 MAG: NrdH-redoxin [Candidatus Staskawiczbacteria bacterium RIFCSPLOWO2_02_FULL_39_8]
MMVIIYSTPTCVYCNSLKQYLTDKNIAYKEIDVSQNEQELEKMVAISGQMGVPVVDIDGNIVIGFDKVKIDELLKLT